MGLKNLFKRAESLGYPQFHSVLTFNSPVFEFIIFERRTKNPIFVLVKNKTVPISYIDVEQEISKIDWEFENSQLDFEDNL